jgi:predicted nucleic acid-binding protein
VTCFADTSVLCALYQKQGAAGRAKALVALLDNAPLVISDIVEFEFKASLKLQVFRRGKGDPEGFSEQEARAASERFDTASDASNAAGIQIIPCAWPHVLVLAASLADKYASQTGARSMDIVHIAAALQLQCSHFATFDDEQWKFAKLAEFDVLPNILPSDFRKIHDAKSA